MKNKLLFIDIDGTITHDDGVISQETRKIISNYNTNYKNIILISGRPRNKVRDICKELNGKYFISSNGSEIFDVENGKIIYRSFINDRTVMFIYEIAKTYDVELIVAVDNGDFSMNSNLNVNVLKNVKQCMLKGTEINLNMVRRKLSLTDDVYISTKKNLFENGYYWLSVLPNNVSKGSTAEYLAQYLKYDLKNTIAIGNDYNDISMFQKLGTGVAVSNACNDLICLATNIIDGNNEDGVKKFLESYIEE